MRREGLKWVDARQLMGNKMSEPWYRRNGPSLGIFGNYLPVRGIGWLCFIVLSLVFLGWLIFADVTGMTNHQPGIAFSVGLAIVVGWQALAWWKSR